MEGIYIAVVEDHSDLRELFVECLSEEGHQVTGFATADDLDEFLPGQHIDLLVLDLNLPGEDGFSIATRLRQSHPALHILMITARTGLSDRLRGYASGADFYLAKPVSPDELVATVSGITRRVLGARLQEEVHCEVHLDRLELCGPAGCVSLSDAEGIVLKTLAEAPGRRLDYWRLFDLLRLEVSDKNKNALEVRVSRLKKKLHQVGAPDPAVKALWKEGYMLCVPVTVHG